MKGLLVVLVFLIVLFVSGVESHLKPSRTASDYYSQFKKRVAARLVEEAKSGRVFYPVDYGADPTGNNCSSDAIMKAINDAFNVESERELLSGIKDLGGVQIDLLGGNYKLTKPLRFPASGGNLVFYGGTLRASDDFPVDQYLIELYSEQLIKNPHNKEGDNYEDITFRDLTLDSNFRGGAVYVVKSVRTRINNCFIIRFTTKGIYVEGGHETFISNSFIGQHITTGGDPDERSFSGTGIELAGNDNTITDVAIFSAATGVLLRGQANILTGVHCYNKATFFGGVGIYVKLPGLSQTRIDNCYLDYNSIVMEDPVQVHVTSSFFLGDGNVVVKKSDKGVISGLNIVDNMFSGLNSGISMIMLDESNGPFNKIDQVIIDRNNVKDMVFKSTVGKLTVAGAGKKWVADFSKILVFPAKINHLQYSLVVKGGGTVFPVHAVTSVSNNTVVVESEQEVEGVVSVAVDQNSMIGEQSLFT